MKPEALTLIGLIGQAGSGKDTAADYLCQRYGFVRASYAAAPRAMLEALLSTLNIDHAWLFERQLKERAMPVLGLSYREMMQTLGTEWGRGLDADIWVRALAATLGLDTGYWVHDRIVVTDARYANEAQFLLQHGARLISLQRSQATAVRDHSSETSISTLVEWATVSLVNNTDRPSDLHARLDGAMDDWGIVQRPTSAPHLGV
jgi:hypothetical protein